MTVPENSPRGSSTDSAEIASAPTDDLSDQSDTPQTTTAEFFRETDRLPHEYVLEEITNADGELPQQTIVDLADWSESYVSKLLGEMEAVDMITRVRLGRENVVYLPSTAPKTEIDPE